MKSQQEDGLGSHSKRIVREVTARRWLGKSHQEDG